jgi:serine/threonine protein kinase
LADIHRCKIAHRDIKPDNIIYCQSEHRWKYTDFGVSSTYSVSKKKWQIEGTFLYLQSFIEEEYKCSNYNIVQDLLQNDIFALGLTLYEFLNPMIEKRELKQSFQNNKS